MTHSPTLPALRRSPALAPIQHAGSPAHAARTDHASDHLRVGRRVSPRTRALLAATCLALCTGVHAQAAPQSPPEGLSGRIGMLVSTTPTYEGSPDDRTLVSPDLTLTYRSRAWGTVQFGQRGLAWNAIETGRFRLALVAQFDLGRKDRDTSTWNPTPGDDRLAGMGKVRASTEAGVAIGYGPVTLAARQSLGQRGTKGAQVDMTIEHAWAVSERLQLHPALTATWADRDYMQAYFGVTAAQAQATSFAAYNPTSGCRKVEATLGAEYALSPTWTLQASLGVSQLGDKAAASPIVGRRNGTLLALGVARAF